MILIVHDYILLRCYNRCCLVHPLFAMLWLLCRKVSAHSITAYPNRTSGLNGIQHTPTEVLSPSISYNEKAAFSSLIS